MKCETSTHNFTEVNFYKVMSNKINNQMSSFSH